MRKKHPPSSSSHLSEETQKHFERSTAASLNSEARHKAVAPQKPPRINKRIINEIPLDPIAREHAKKIERWFKAVHGNDQAFLNSEALYITTVTPQGQHLLRENVTDKVKGDSVVKVCAEKIQRWTKAVYGRQNALHANIDDILKDPMTKDLLLTKIKEDSASVRGLAGIKIFGFKTKARKQAEEALPYLYSAINVYAKAVCQTYESMNIKVPTENRALEKSLQKSLTTEKKEPSLSNDAITGLVQSDSNVRRYEARIVHWSKIVYGKPNVFDKKMEDMLQDNTLEKQLLWDLARNPTSLHRFAGRSTLGFKNDARRCAENSLPHLYDAVKNYAQAIKEAKEFILQEQKIQQERIKLSESPRQEIKQKLQRGQERQHTPQHDVQQHGARSGKRMAFAM
ncbi:BID domain-containing T4SS effector [Bartonella sp. B39]